MIRYRSLLFCVACVCALSSASAEPDQTGLRGEALDIVQRFAGQLKPRLLAAMSEGGTTRAIEVCAEQATFIAESLSDQTGWQVKRVSDRHRNPSAAPDSWESHALERLKQQKADGSDLSMLMFDEIVGSQYRFAKAQIAEPLCLACHGENIDDATRAALADYYPDDTAVGYRAGEIRGIFSLWKSLDFAK